MRLLRSVTESSGYLAPDEFCGRNSKTSLNIHLRLFRQHEYVEPKPRQLKSY
jgi:hypothetical protein